MEYSTFVAFFASILLLSTVASAIDTNVDVLCIQLQANYYPYNECRSTFGRDLRSKDASYEELAVIIIDIITTNKTNILNKLTLLQKNETDSSVKSVIVGCSKIYMDVSPLLTEAKSAATTHDFKGAAEFLLKVKNAASACSALSKGKNVRQEVVMTDSEDLVTLAWYAKITNEIVSNKG